jgi:hypothetical protein
MQQGIGRGQGPGQVRGGVRPPTTHVATAPRQVWCWDRTYLPATVIGMWFHLYLILDLYSRKIVGWELHATDDSVHAAHLVRRTALAEGIATMLTKPVLHGDNGATLKATTVLGMLYWLGVKPSYSRPRVSDGDEHRHSGIRYVTPGQRHCGADHAILAARHDLYLQARERNPARWSGPTRDWTPIGAVTLNPERDSRAVVQQDLAARRHPAGEMTSRGGARIGVEA